MSVPSLSSLAILKLLSPDQQEELYYVLRKKHIQRRSDTDNELSDQEESNEDSDEKFRKYFFSRKGQIEMAEEEFPMLDT